MKRSLLNIQYIANFCVFFALIFVCFFFTNLFKYAKTFYNFLNTFNI